MAEEATGLPYQSDNPTGSGAVYFDKAPSLQETTFRLMADADAEAARRRASQKDYLKLGYDLIADLNPDVKGILDSDAPFIREKAKDLHSFISAGIANGVNPDNPKFADWYHKAQYMKDELQTYVEASKADKQSLFNFQKQWSEKPDDFDGEKTANAWAAFRATPLDVRMGYDRSKLLAPSGNDFDTMLQGFVKKNFDKMQKSQEFSSDGGIYTEQLTEENMTPQQMRQIADAMPTFGEFGNALNKKWEQQLPEIREQYAAPYIANGDNPSLAEDKAKKDFAYDRLNLFHKMGESEKYKGQSPALREAAKSNAQIQKYSWIPKMVSDVFNGNANTMSKRTYVPISGKPVEVYGTTAFNGIKLTPFKVNEQVGTEEKIVDKENVPLMVFEKDGDVWMATTESKTYADPNRPETEFIRFNSPGEFMTYITGRMPDKNAATGAWMAVDAAGARVSGGNFDPNKLAPMNAAQIEQKKKAKGETTRTIPLQQAGQQKATGVKVKVKMPDGTTGEIPEENLEAFKKKYPDAKILQ